MYDEPQLITRIVTSSVLAMLLLLLGLAGLGDNDAGGASHDDVAAGIHLVENQTAVSTGGAVADIAHALTPGAGTVLCIAGLVCGMIALLLLRRLARARAGVAHSRPGSGSPRTWAITAHRVPPL